MTSLIRRFGPNPLGRDFAVGDIHGFFARLQARLDAAGFDPSRDRLFSVGDLVDRGPECEQVLTWLARPWFHAVRGNHEDFAIRLVKGNPVDLEIYSRNGGDWFIGLEPERRQQFAAAFEQLPFAIEVETVRGRVGIVHANVPAHDWNHVEDALGASRRNRDRTIWDRSRVEWENTRPVSGVRAVVVGHTPLRQVKVLGNVHHIDTGGWLPEGHFTLLDLATLEPV